MPKKNRKPKHKTIVELTQGEGRRKAGPIMGVDVHKEVNYYCIVTEKQILAEGSVSNTKNGIKQLTGLCSKYEVVSTGVESTAQYHFKLVHMFLEDKLPILVANPKQTKNTQGKKTDKVDAQRIAIAHRDGRLRPSVISPPDVMALRKGLRLLLKMTQEKTKIKQRLNQVFHQKDVKLQHLLKNKWGLYILHWLTIKDIPQLLDEYVPKSTKRATARQELGEALRQFQSSLNELEQLTFGTDIARLMHLELLTKRLSLVYYMQAEKNSQFKEQLQILLSIPGIGPDTAAAILAEIVDISYFDSPEKLVKWAGLAPTVYQSGHRQKKTGKIFKAGNKFIRRAVVMSAMNIFARGKDSNPIKTYMKSKYTSKGAYWLALCAGARKLVTIVWHLLKTNQNWSPQVTSHDILAQTRKIVLKKIKIFENSLKKFKKVNERLTQESSSILSSMEERFKPPKELMKALLQSV